MRELSARILLAGRMNLPSGSALVNFLLNGTRSRLGRLCTNLKVYVTRQIRRVGSAVLARYGRVEFELTFSLAIV